RLLRVRDVGGVHADRVDVDVARSARIDESASVPAGGRPGSRVGAAVADPQVAVGRVDSATRRVRPARAGCRPTRGTPVCDAGSDLRADVMQRVGPGHALVALRALGSARPRPTAWDLALLEVLLQERMILDLLGRDRVLL